MISIILGIIMGIFHYFSNDIRLKYKKFYPAILSFSAGISVTYIFLDLFPRFSKGATSHMLFFPILIGFIIFHLIEKYIYKHSPADKLLKELALEDSIISFVYHFIIGMIFVYFINQNFMSGILFFIPVMIYTAVSVLPVDPTRNKTIQLIIASSTLLGILYAKYIYTNISLNVFSSLLGFIIGALIFTVMRHSLPSEDEGKPWYFMLGVAIYATLLILLAF